VTTTGAAGRRHWSLHFRDLLVEKKVVDAKTIAAVVNAE
jgi:hypothetical protein